MLEIHLREKFAGVEKNFQEDIAVLLLASQFTYSEMVRPVCLSLSNRDLYDRQVRPGYLGYVSTTSITRKGGMGIPSITNTPAIGHRKWFATTILYYIELLTKKV